jgi:hypothetical protein
MQGFQCRGRNIVTGFAPQQFEGSALLVRPMRIGLPKPSIEICRSVLSAFGEIEKLRSAPDGFVVNFFDIRAAQNALSNSGIVVIAGVCHLVERLAEQGVYAPAVYPPAPVYAPATVYPQAAAYGMAVAAPVPESIRVALLNLQEKLKPIS